MKDVFSLAGKRAVITGASKGIGEAIAIAMAERGADVLLVARNVEKLTNVSRRIETLGRACAWVDADVSTPEGIARVKAAADEFGPVHCYVNNAAFTLYKTPLESDAEDIDALFDTNFKGAFCLTREMAQRMIRQGQGGVILFVTSINAQSALPSQALYSCTKASLESMMRSFAAELGGYGIRVNSLAPGAVRTDMNPHFTPQKLSEMGEKIPLGHVGEPEEIADVAVFLCSDASRYMTGSTVVVDGGYLLRR